MLIFYDFSVWICFFFIQQKKKKMLPISKSNNISCYFKLRLTRKKRLFVITTLLNILKKTYIFMYNFLSIYFL